MRGMIKISRASDLSGLSAGTGKLCIVGSLELVFIWSCFVSRLLSLLFYISLLTDVLRYSQKEPTYMKQ